LISLSCLFVIVLAFLAKRYPFGYQWPLLYSFLSIFFLIAAVSFLFVETSFSNILFTSPMFEAVPLLGEYYPGVGGLSPDDVHRGDIEGLLPSGFVIRGFFGGTSTVVIASETDVMSGGIFKTGTVVVVFGERSPTGTIEAAGVEQLAN